MRVIFEAGGYDARPTPAIRRRAATEGAEATTEEDSSGSPEAGATRPNGEKLSVEERAQVAELRRRDREVRAHEAAHAAAAGAAGGGASFTYTTGPDGNQYAVGGEVPVQLRSGRTHEETIRNAARVRAAALAPADPSVQDRAVAAAAAAMEAAARAELLEQGSEASERFAEPARESGEAAPSGENPEMQLLALETELKSTGTSIRHLHSSGACGTCAARVSAYR